MSSWRSAQSASSGNRTSNGTTSTADEFASFDEPGWGKIVANFSVLPYGTRATLLTYECRTVTTDPASRQKFLRYWTVIRPFVAHIFRATVRTIRDNAEPQPT